MNRRSFLAAGAALVGACRRRSRNITGRIVGASHDIGHLLRGGGIPAVSGEERTAVAIVGGGIAGLSAGWWLQRKGLRDFRIFELEDAAGGNSRFGANEVSAYPWGAHYIPLPTRECVFVHALLEELQVVNSDGVYDERYLCAAPQERLFIHGRWQDGILPLLAASPDDLDEFERFRELIQGYKTRRDALGRKAFAIPMELSSRDADLLVLDRISMAQFLRDRGFKSERLLWYVNYACRDDFGCRYSDVSAWAGIHYYASRDASNDDEVLTWPEGNGWIVRRLAEKLKSNITNSAVAFRIENTGRARGGNVEVDVYHVSEKRSVRVIADHVIFACPTFLAPFVVRGAEEFQPVARTFQYAPWLVANLTLDEFPAVRAGAPLSWDNVIYDSDSLGYVVATHQSLNTHQRETVLTYYNALAAGDPALERQRLLNTDWSAWAEAIIADLSKPHSEIRGLIRNIDIMKWGHAMVRPVPGFLWGDARQRAARGLDRIHFAHSDLSGFSIFEEAQYRGIVAAEKILEKHG